MENIVITLCILAGLALIILFLIGSDVRSRKKNARMLEASFGKVPFPACDPASAALFYLRRTEDTPSDRRVDDLTWNDLDMDRVFLRIDNCLTSVGDEVLYDRLRESCFALKPLQELERLIGWLDGHPSERSAIRGAMSTLGRRDYNGLSDFLFRPDIRALRFGWAFPLLALLPLLFLLLIPFQLPAGLFLLSLSAAANILIYFIQRRNIEAELSTLRYLSALLWCANKLCSAPLPGLEWFIEPLRASLTPLRPLRGKLSGAARAAMARSDADTLLDLVRAVFLGDLRDYGKAVKLAAAHAGELLSLFQRFGTLDMAISLLSFRKSLPGKWCLPTFLLQNRLEFEELSHPLLEHPVPNTALFDRDCIVTGSNASGKSTFIKAAAVNALLAQTIHTCAAASFQTRFALVISSMAVRDDITTGDSYFVAEIKSLHRILKKTETVSCLCFIDEILRGTNTVERIAASSAVLRALSDADCLCVAASHDMELTAILGGWYDNFHFRETITDDGIEFDYKLHSGPSRTRNAILLLEQMDFPAGVIDTANGLVHRYDVTRKWGSL